VSFKFKIGLLYHDSSVVSINSKLYLQFHEQYELLPVRWFTPRSA
jgi:hypothetical protein